MAKNEADKNLSRTEKLKRAAKNVLRGSSHAIKLTHLGVRTLQTLGVPLPFVAPAVAGLNALADLSEVREVEEALNKVTDGDLEGVVDNVDVVADKIDRLSEKLERGDDELIGKILGIQDEYRKEIARFAQQTLDKLSELDLRGDKDNQEIRSTLVDVCKLLNDSRRSTEEVMDGITGKFSEKIEELKDWMNKKLDDGFAETHRRLDQLPDAIISKMDERERKVDRLVPEFGPKESAMRVIFVQFDESGVSPSQKPGKYWYAKFGITMRRELELMGVEFKNSNTVIENEETAEEFCRFNDADLVIWGYLADDVFKVVYTNNLSFSFAHIYFSAYDETSNIKDHIKGGALTEKMFYFTRALVMWRNGDNEEAYKYLTRAIGLEGIDCSAIYFFRAMTGIELGYEEANILSDIEESYRLDPDRKDLFFYLRGRLYEGTGDTRQALENYHKVVDLNIGEDMIFHSLHGIGTVHAKLKKYRKAVEYFNEALKITRSPHVLYNRGYINMELGLLKEAIRDFTEVINIISDSTQGKYSSSLNDKAATLYYRSICFRKRHEHKKADEDFEAYRLICESLRQSRGS